VVDHPSDKAAVLWSVRAPDGWRVITNAPRACVRRRGRACRESRPLATYLMVLGATRMSVSRHRPLVSGRDTIPIEVWSYPEDSAWADAAPFRRATEIAESLQSIVGPFPYSRLAHVQSSTRYGGMENASAIFYSERNWSARRLGEGVVRHETAHQWFGDAVTPRDFAHAWLSEGFASYFDAVAGAALDGDTVLTRIMRSNRERWMASDVLNRPVVDSTQTDPARMLNSNTYQKGAWVLHMLRGLLGDAAFFRGIRDYYRVWRDSSVATGQFQSVVERAAGRRLGWFFDQWLRQPGHPSLQVEWSVNARLRRVVVRYRQVQPESWGLYRLDRVPVRLVLPGGGIAERWISLRAGREEQQQVFVMGGDLPEALVVDPDTTLLLTAEVRAPRP
jgi:aminopeptidase N